MKLQHYKPKGDLVVGNYLPTEDWGKHIHFAVMDKANNNLYASTGYLGKVNGEVIYKLEDYKNAACCIEQAQLYANAHKLFEILEEYVDCIPDIIKHTEARRILRQITDISETANRLLGEDAMTIICRIEAETNV